jgi:ribosome biogenesis GTPase / thiamine phosphate phosphatase
VWTEGDELACVPAGILRRHPQGDPAVGDHVVLDPKGDPSLGRIIDILPRRNRLARRAAGPKPVGQVLAANIDRIIPVFAVAEPKPHWFLLDRFLVEADAAGIEPLICVTKVDLFSDADLAALSRDLDPYRALGIEIVLTSTETGEGMAALASLTRDRISVLIGKSGVGKSTLINGLLSSDVDGSGAPGELRTAEISRKTRKGRQTTTQVRMLRLAGGRGGIIDTPGICEFGLWEIPREEIASHFPEMRPWIRECRFGGACSHSHEPGCAIKEAVRDGRCYPNRYRSYLRLIGAPAPKEETFHHSAKNERDRAPEVEAFKCVRCGTTITSDVPGTAHRNHCPQCLHSRHVDRKAGDRAAGCESVMAPIAISVRPDGEWTLVHRCNGCGVIKANRIAGDDNPLLLMSLAARPLARPPFPLDRGHSLWGSMPYDIGDGGAFDDSSKPDI